MMNTEEAINPGYINRITPLSQTRVMFNNANFVNAEVHDKGVIITYEVDCYTQYIRLSITLKHIKTAGSSSFELVAFKAFFSFNVYRVSEMDANDFFVVLENCFHRINEAGKLETPPIANPIPVPLNQFWENKRALFDEIADRINYCPEVTMNNP